MRRNWIYIALIALSMTLVSADVASAKKHRASRGEARSHVKRDSHRGRGSRELSKREKRVRDKYAGRREKRSGRLGSSRRHGRVRHEPQVSAAPSAPRPAPGISSERTAEIQNALIKIGYMNGPATGQYDDPTIEAMKKFQAVNGLSQTGLPSAPLLKKLGVSKRSNDGYAVPVNSVSQTDKKRTQE